MSKDLEIKILKRIIRKLLDIIGMHKDAEISYCKILRQEVIDEINEQEG